MKILVSGFEPFGGLTINPSQVLVESLPKVSGAELSGVVLPTTFRGAFDVLKREIDRTQPDAVVALGVAGGRYRGFELERVALNVLDARMADNEGEQPIDQPILIGEPAALFSTLPIRDLLNDLKSQKIPVRISNSAGTYVCNYLFYRLQEANQRTPRRSGFVHLPYLEEQLPEVAALIEAAVEHESRAERYLPALSRAEMQRGFAALLQSLVRGTVK